MGVLRAEKGSLGLEVEGKNTGGSFRLCLDV